MLSIKIECRCGQRYAFDVEATGDHMPYAVACPICGTDGTDAANAAIAQSKPAQSAIASPVGVRLHTAAPAPVVAGERASVATSESSAPRPTTLRPGQTDPAHAQIEARSKILWGDPPADVVRFLMMHGISYEEASALVATLVQERVTTVRGTGVRKVVTGIALVCVPIVAYFIFARIGIIPMKLFAVTIMVGLWGAWLLLKGTIMLLFPKSEPGDVADQ